MGQSAKHLRGKRNLRGTDLSLSRQVGQSALHRPVWSQLGRVLAGGEAWGQSTPVVSVINI